MAKELADRLGGDLDVVLVHKIGAPENPEFAIGSVSEFGTLYRSPVFDYYETSQGYLDSAVQEEIAKLKKRRQTYSGIHPPIDPEGRTVIIVDDGIATGATMLAAVRAIRLQKPGKIIVASPVASVDAAELLRSEADELMILDTPEPFYAISQFYGEFAQVSDDEVNAILRESGRGAKPKRVA